MEQLLKEKEWKRVESEGGGLYELVTRKRLSHARLGPLPNACSLDLVEGGTDYYSFDVGRGELVWYVWILLNKTSVSPSFIILLKFDATKTTMDPTSTHSGPRGQRDTNR
jgi:hypothetical protein